MTKRLGSGEYERADVEVKQSDIEARYSFLKALKAKRSLWIYDLLRLFKYDETLKEFLENDKVDFTVHLFLSNLLSRERHKIKINSDIINTPLINYYWFLLDKGTEIKRLENEKDTQNLVEFHNPIKRRNHALKKLVPSWKELKIRTDAKALCTSLEDWAKEYNLNEDWFLDFALGILRLFKSEFDFKLLNFVWTNTSPNEAHSHRINYELEVKHTISKALSEYWRHEVWTNKWLGSSDSHTLPAFKYRWRDFELPPLIWLVRMSSRKGFVEKMQENLQHKVEQLRQSNQLYSYSNNEELNQLLENKRLELESYCDYVEQQKSNVIDIRFLPAVDFEVTGKFVWYPTKQHRKQFVEKNLIELKTQIEKNHKALKSYETFTKRHFKAEITKYCNKLEKLLPKNWVTTPLKYSEEKHFEWLVDFQVPTCKSYTQIAKENKVHITTVKENVTVLAQKIGISLRNAKHTGRPKGTKDSKTSLRKLNIFRD